MQVIKTIKEMQALNKSLRFESKTIGFVPTMGALHEGHLSLVRRSKSECDVTVVSIFVNPAQFGPQEDFDRYPRDIEGDLNKLKPVGVDVVFMPGDKEMYSEGSSINVDVGDIGKVLCGALRPSHFNGVALVVTKLFNIIVPDRAYFGQKDFQQSVIIKKLVRELNFDIDIVVCPIIRESDGLAMSSRNTYLNNNEERSAAPILYKALRHGEELILNKGISDASIVKEEMENLITSNPIARINYIDIVDTENLHSVKDITQPVALCGAVWIGKTRLIDNIIIDRDGVLNASGGTYKSYKAIRSKSIGGFIEERLGSYMRKIKRLESFDLYNIVVSEVEKALISMVLKETEGNQLRAAKLLGINRNTLRSKIKSLGIKTKT